MKFVHGRCGPAVKGQHNTRDFRHITALGFVFSWPSNPFTMDGRMFSFGRDGGRLIFWGWYK
jgi:hypothetical protein